MAAEASELAAGVREVSPREELLQELRPVAFAIAYRMLGSVSEAEDVVQEALLRVHRALQAGEQLTSPRGFVATVSTRLAIDELRSARARREQYVGEWLPEPIITDGDDDPARHAETADSLSLAMLVLLESLSPEQRAVLLLHDVFDYGYPEIAAIIGNSEGNVRQLATRADATSRSAGPASKRRGAARRTGTTILSGRRTRRPVGAGGAARPRRGADRRRRRQGSRLGAHAARPQPCSRTLIDWTRLAARTPGRSLRPVEVNGGAGALYLDAQQRLIAVVALEIAGGQITSIHPIVNPDKLTHLGPVGDFGSPWGSAR